MLKYIYLSKYVSGKITSEKKAGLMEKEIGAISQLGAEKITFPPKSDRRTDIRTDRHTDGRT